MRLLFEFSGEHPTLPKSELCGCLESEGFGFRTVLEEGRLAVLDFGKKKIDVERIASRLALTRSLDEYILSCTPDKVLDCATGITLPNGTFRVRVKRLNQVDINCNALEKRIGEVVAERSGNRVSLETPKTELRLLVGDSTHFAIRLRYVDRSVFEKRKVNERPFFSPISMHPRLARALVNLSGARRRGILLDPFCGTGGILIEAGLIRCRLVGSDISRKMVDGTEKNLRCYGLSAELHACDVGQIDDFLDEKIGSIATDPPYGRSASTKGESVSNLYNRAFEAFSRVLRKGGNLAIVLPGTHAIDLGKEYLSLQEFHPMRVHKSLTRYFCVYKKV